MSINYYYFSCRVAYNLSHCGVVIILYTFKHLRSLLNQVKKCGQKVNNKVLCDLNNKKKKNDTKIKLTTYNMNLLIYSINLYQL